MLVDDLRARLPSSRTTTDSDVVTAYSRDHAEAAPFGRAVAVVKPHTAEEAQVIVQTCIEYNAPIVCRGAGTGLSGGANAIDGGVIVSFEKMAAVLEIDSLERIAVVQPGVVNQTLRTTAAEQGLWYPPDPASAPWSTIGGNVATNAGGLCCVKYGVTKDYVLGMQVVTGNGELVRLGRRTAKGVAGLDLTALMVGSEGTLGLITEITLKLRPAREPERTIAGYFDTLHAAGKAVEAVAAAGLTPSALELVDRQCLLAVDKWKRMGLAVDANVVLLGRVDTPGAAGDDEAERMRLCFDDAGATWSARSTDEAEAEALFEARKLAYLALERLGPVMTEDVCVPKRAVPEMLSRIEKIAETHGILIANIAHAGDGNLHPLLVMSDFTESGKARAYRAFDDIMSAAIELGGTVTGEHGVGLLKMNGMAREQSRAAIDMQWAVKHALDPHHIFNPGKVLPHLQSAVTTA